MGAGRTRVDGYAVEIHNYRTACHDLLLFSNKRDAENAYDNLRIISDSIDEGLYESEYEVDEALNFVFDSADEYIEAIDFRREIDNNDIWSAGDGTKYKIVNPRTLISGISI